jgi:hypothetical protein
VSNNTLLKGLLVLFAALLVAAGVAVFAGGGPSMSVSPGQGPDGTSGTITITGADANAPVTITYDGRFPDTGTTDAKGSLTITHVFNGNVGDKIAIEALIGPASEQSASATFEITGTTGGGDPTPVSVSLSPDSGPTGTSSQISVTGEPNQPVTLTIGGNAVTNGTTDASGSWTYDFTFNGSSGDQISVEAQVGSSSSSPKGSATFTVTGATDTPREVSISVDPPSGTAGTSGTITVTGEPNQPVTLTIGSGVTNGMTDASGNFSHTTTFSGADGDRITIDAQVGSTADSPRASTSFEVTAAPAASVTVTVDPTSGPSGTSGTITVTGEPNQPVTLTIGSGTTAGTTDANGNFTYQTTFFGRVGDTIAIEAQVGPTGDSPKASTEFEITGASISQVTYFAGFVVIFDDGGHVIFVGLPDVMSLLVTYGSIMIEGPEPFVAVAGEVADDGSFTATGTGTVAGFSDITVIFEGVITPESLTGEYTMGADGGLPGGEAIVFEVTGEAVEAEGADFASFYDLLNAAWAAGDSPRMAELLHPAVIDRYGAEACVAYLESIAEPAVLIEPLEELAFGDWSYERDEISTPIVDALTLRVRVTTGDAEPRNQEVHIAVRPDGSLGWFTDCGEPLT